MHLYVWPGAPPAHNWSGRNDFDVGNIHYKGHWKGWAPKIEPFWSLKWQQAKRVPFWPRRFFHRHLLSMAQVMDLPASKSISSSAISTKGTHWGCNMPFISDEYERIINTSPCIKLLSCVILEGYRRRLKWRKKYPGGSQSSACSYWMSNHCLLCFSYWVKKHIKLSKVGNIDKDISFIRLFSDGSCLLHLSKSLRSSKSA